MCWAFAKLGLTDEALFDALAQAVQEALAELEGFKGFVCWGLRFRV